MHDRAAPSNLPATQGAWKVFGRIVRLLRPQAGMVLAGLALLLASMPMELFPAFVWMYVADALIMKQPTAATEALHVVFSFGNRLTSCPALLASSLVWLMVIYAIGEAFGTLSTNLLSRVAQKFIFSLRNTVYRKLQSQSLSYLQRQRTGDLMSRAIGDVDELQSFTVNGIEVIIGEGLMWFTSVAIVMMLDWRVASAALAPLLVVYFLLRIFNRRVAPIYKDARERAGEVSNRLQENLSGMVVIKIFGKELDESRRFRDATEASYRSQLRAINARSLFFPFSRGVGFLSNVAMIGVGGYLILSGGTFTVGKLLLFRSYWWRLFGPVQTLARVNDMVQRAIAAARRVFEVLDAPDEVPDALNAKPLPTVDGAMALSNVTFSYGSSDVLRDLSIDIPQGRTIALCGPSGSGKTTVLSLLLRFYDPVKGSVTLDGHDLRSISRDSLRSHFALVQQETFLFNDSILDNIRYGHGEATMAQVIEAARAANALQFIEQLPKGFDTKVGERGVRLSGGQKQRISIARAFLADPAILLLDEPTSSVEPESEAAIITALDRLMRGRTTVLTSHRPSLIKQADLVYVIEEGQVTERGAPDELIRNGAWFARFIRSAEEALPDFEPAPTVEGAK